MKIYSKMLILQGQRRRKLSDTNKQVVSVEPLTLLIYAHIVPAVS